VSAATVRAAISSFLASPAIPGVTKQYRAMPWYIDGANWNLADNLGSGAVIALHLANDDETRESGGQVIGLKDTDYVAFLVVLYQYLIPSGTQATAYQGDEYIDPLDAVIEAIKDRLHSDPSLGNPAVIKTSGQEPRDLHVERSLPRREPGKLLAWNTIRFSVTEVIQA
jgi:hypothetical protein